MTTASGQLNSMTIGHTILDDNLGLSTKSHGASGMLDPENVVFYHPLDDNTEHTLTDIWDGSGVFVPGIIGSGVSAVTSDAILFDSGSGSFDGASAASRCRIALLETDKIIISALHFTNTWHNRVVVASASGDTINYGDVVQVRTGNMRIDVVGLSPSSAVFVSQAASIAGKATVGTISGLDITLGSEFQYDANGANWVSAFKIDSTRFVVAYQDTGNSNFGTLVIGEVSGTTITYGSQFVYSSVGTGRTIFEMIDNSKFVITYNTAIGVLASIGSLSGTTITSVSNGVLVEPSGWDSTKFNNQFDTKILDASGTKLMVAVSYNNGTGAFGFTGRATIGSISGTDITFDSGSVIFTAATNINATSPISMILLRDGAGVIAWKKVGSPHNGSIHNAIFNTSGATITSTGPPALVGAFEMFDIDMVRLDNTRLFLSAAKDAPLAIHSFVGELPDGVTLSSDNPNYPEPIDNKNLATFFWSKNPTKNRAEVILGRGYNITFTSGSIALGGSTATWNSASIQSLMSTLNNDSTHSLATFFEYQGGTNWNLKTSLDGAPFVDRGVQDAGSQILLTSSTDAKITLIDPDNENQWIDEAVLWAGEPEQLSEFGNFELFKLNGLASILDETMPSFSTAAFPASASGNLAIPNVNDSTQSSGILLTTGHDLASSDVNLVMPNPLDVLQSSGLLLSIGDETATSDIDLVMPNTFDSLQSSGTLLEVGHQKISSDNDLMTPNPFVVLQSSGVLVTEGFVQSESGLTLFMAGVSAEATFEKIVDVFLVTGDFVPSIIGLLSPTSINVTVEIFDLLDGSNTQLTLTNDTAFAIGDTGRFGWSTSNLPLLNRHGGQYLFRMTDSLGETFVGEFFLNSPESRLS